ncbi:MAG: phosphate signaling complex protein PhoU [Planctomycetota bacterium]
MPTRAIIEKLKNDLIVMGEMCENALSSAVMALIDGDEEMAASIIEYDREIDERELALNQDCLKLFGSGALKKEDLRFAASALKISYDLERIGDQAVDVCGHVLFLVREQTLLSQVVDFASLVEQVGQMMRESVRALVEQDANLAWKMIGEIPVVHEEGARIFAELLAIMHESSRTIERCCHILAVSRSLERVAALTTNIAEEVIYLVEGKTVRHRLREHKSLTPSLLSLPMETPEEAVRRETDILQRHTRRLEKKGKGPAPVRRR